MLEKEFDFKLFHTKSHELRIISSRHKNYCFEKLLRNEKQQILILADNIEKRSEFVLLCERA
jgi:hypothetical protein